MASLSLKNIYKVYPNSDVAAVKDFNLEIEDNVITSYSIHYTKLYEYPSTRPVLKNR